MKAGATGGFPGTRGCLKTLNLQMKIEGQDGTPEREERLYEDGLDGQGDFFSIDLKGEAWGLGGFMSLGRLMCHLHPVQHVLQAA